ncbi:MAG: IS5 family transposase [Variovorax sp.]|nr:IS5 family transposase [Variovorax sp.]
MRKPYKTDLTDQQWEYIRPHLPPSGVKNGAEPTDLREVINTLLYQMRTGVQWDLLPHDLAPKSTAFDYYTRWSSDGTWVRILDAARRAIRAAAGRDEAPSAAAIDSQSVRTAAGGADEVGTDGGKRVKGRKRHIATDTLGLLLAVVVTAANVSDGRAAPRVLDRLTVPDRTRLEVVFADGRYHDTVCAEWFATHPGCRLEVVSKPARVRGFVPIHKRWVVERTFAWLVANRRLVRDYERRIWSSESRVILASIAIMLRRLSPPNDDVISGCVAINNCERRRSEAA